MTREHADAADDAGAVKTVALVLEVDLDASIETVWQALTDPDIVAAWLLPGAIAAEPGQRFAFAASSSLGGRIDCEILESDAPHRLSYLWRIGDRDGPTQDTVVGFDLAPLPDNRTHLKLVHDGFVVPLDHPVDRVAAEADIIVLLPIAAIARRRIRRPRPAPLHQRGALPLVMRLAA